MCKLVLKPNIMKIIPKLVLGTLLFAATLTSCNSGAEKKDAAADSAKAAVDTVKPKVDSLAVLVDTVKKDSGNQKDVKTVPHN